MSKTPRNPALSRRFVLSGSATTALTFAWASDAVAAPTMNKAPLPPTSKPKPTATAAKGPAAIKAKPLPTSRKAIRGSAPVFERLDVARLNPELQPLGDAIAAKIRHGVAAAAAEPTRSFAKDGYAAVAQQYVRALPRKNRRATMERANALFKAPIAERQKTFGDFAGTPIAEHAHELELPEKILTSLPNYRLVLEKTKPLFVAKKMPPKFSMQPKRYDKLGFFINQVRCLEETDEIGADRIVMGGILLAPNGARHHIKRFHVSKDFDEGEKVTYYNPDHIFYEPTDPHKGFQLASADLPPNDTAYPGNYTLVLLMFEEDSGSFGAFLEKLWARIADEVEAALKGVEEAIATVFGEAIAELVGYILGAIVDFFKQLFDNPDDFINQMTSRLSLGSARYDYFASLPGELPNTPDGVWAANHYEAKFYGDGGRYKVRLHWRVYDT